MDLSKHFKLEDFIDPGHIATIRRIVVNVLEPIQQRFGTVIINNAGSDLYSVAFKVEGYDNSIIAEYIEHSLVHSFLRVGREWIYVECDAGT